MRKVLIFIMAGGKGERLYPLTLYRAKPAVPFGGMYRIIDFTLSNCINSGMRKIHVLIQYRSISLTRHLIMGWSIFDSELGEYIDVIPAQHAEGRHLYLGTADSIYQNMDAIQVENPDFIMILAGDHVYKMNYQEMLLYHIEKKADCTVSVVEMPKEKSREFGIVEADYKGIVTGFQEKPTRPKTIPGDPKRVFASMGIYIFSRKILEEVLKADSKSKRSEHDFGRNILPWMVRSGYKVAAHNFKDENKKEAKYWRDIGNLDAYYEANMDLVQVTPVFNMYDREWPIRTYQEQTPPAKTVFAQTEVEGGRRGMALDSLVSPGCIISGGQVERSILSPNVRINSYSHVTDSVLMEGVDVGRYAKIRRAIIDKDVKIPKNEEIGYNIAKDKKRFHVTESGIVVVAKGSKL
ncbi:MAG: glucose-1-phosphate adenylyltransferase [Candidatus Omnitrophica bacterium]|nr:glucose-1-phosphate adenylyltransferase [Candidatus Omnitrophota bacterium]